MNHGCYGTTYGTAGHYPAADRLARQRRRGSRFGGRYAVHFCSLPGGRKRYPIQAYIGSLDRVDYFVKALGLVNSAGDFYNMPAVMNGYSDLMVEIFGHRGQHARAAMGAYVLPGNMPVSVDAIVKIRR